MRLSLRKAVTLAAFVAALLLVNVLIGLNLSFSGIENSEKVLGHLRHDNGEPLSSGTQLLASLGQDVQSRQQRSAKSVPRPFLIDNLEPGAEVKSRISNGAQKGKLSTELAKSQRLSHARPTELGDIFISVKTSGKFHATRLQLVLQTWYLLAREQTYFFTDKDDPAISQSTGRTATLGEGSLHLGSWVRLGRSNSECHYHSVLKVLSEQLFHLIRLRMLPEVSTPPVIKSGHLVNTNCTPSHTRQSLCCKTSVEFDAYLASKKRWMCHFDDDTYVNIPELVDLLKRYKHTEDWYLGKPSLRHPMEVNDVYNPGAKVTFWFATGSGFCVSRGLALKMMPHAGGGRLKAIGDKLRLPDDCVIGYIIEHLLKTQLTVIEGFRSHLEALWLIKSTQLKKQITLSYSKYGDKENVVNVAGFSHEEDPTRMKSVHCHLFSTFRECKKIQHA